MSVMLPTSRLKSSSAKLINFTDSSNLWKVSFFKICSGTGSSLMIALMARSHCAASELSFLVFYKYTKFCRRIRNRRLQLTFSEQLRLCHHHRAIRRGVPCSRHSPRQKQRPLKAWSLFRRKPCNGCSSCQ